MSLYAIEISAFTDGMNIPVGLTGWTPAETDQVVVSLGGNSVSDANIPLRVAWDSVGSVWKVYSDDTSGSYTGKIQVMIRVPSS